MPKSKTLKATARAKARKKAIPRCVRAIYSYALHKTGCLEEDVHANDWFIGLIERDFPVMEMVKEQVEGKEFPDDARHWEVWPVGEKHMVRVNGENEDAEEVFASMIDRMVPRVEEEE
jgi:hypothetical protein